MAESLEEVLTAIHEIRDLLRLMAEPAIAERDRKLRDELKRLVGASPLKAKAVMLMDGTRAQSIIQRDSGIQKSHLSTFVKQLGLSKLLSSEGKEPKLAILVPANFFDDGDTDG